MSNQEQTQRDRDLTEALRSGRTARGGAKLLSVLGGVLVILGVIAGGALPLLIAGAALLALGGWLGQKKAATVRQQIGDTVALDALRAVFDEVATACRGSPAFPCRAIPTAPAANTPIAFTGAGTWS